MGPIASLLFIALLVWLGYKGIRDEEKNP